MGYCHRLLTLAECCLSLLPSLILCGRSPAATASDRLPPRHLSDPQGKLFRVPPGPAGVVRHSSRLARRDPRRNQRQAARAGRQQRRQPAHSHGQRQGAGQDHAQGPAAADRSRRSTSCGHWIDQGLTWDEQLLPPLGGSSPITGRFSRSRSRRCRSVKNQAWVRNPIDAFIAAKHGRTGLRRRRPPIRGRCCAGWHLGSDRLAADGRGGRGVRRGVGCAERETASRACRSPGGSRLLTSPHYGERWGRHWLDVARWAESEGYESNHLRPYAWRYRDWVVARLQRDMPFADFVRAAARRRRDHAVLRRQPHRHRLPRRRPAQQQRGGPLPAAQRHPRRHRQRDRRARSSA